MFNKIKKAIKEMSKGETPFDASQFNDSIALQTDWSPAKPGGTNFKTHRLVEVRYDRVEFKPTKGLYLFCGVFILFGIGAILLGLFIPAEGPVSDDQWGVIVPLLFGLLFSGVGFGMIYFFSVPRVFDKSLGVYWKGRKEPKFYSDTIDPKNSAKLSDIHAIQLLKEYISSDKSNYYSYELNLVLKDGKRMNVVDYGNHKKMQEAAKKLAQFLGKPLWDATH